VCRLAVTALEGQGLSAEQAHLPAALTEALAAAVTDASGCDVISSADIAAIAGFEAQRELCGVRSDACLAEIGDALGVDRIVAGSVVQLGQSTTVTARVVNIKASRVEARAEETTSDPEALRSMAQRIGTRLFQPDAEVAISDDFPVLLAAGGVGVGVGVVVVSVGAAVAFSADAVLGDKNADRATKESAQGSGTIGVAVAVVGGVLIAVGAAVAAYAAISE